MSDQSQLIAEALFAERISPEEYGSQQTYQNHLIEQYKLYVQMADHISTRRQSAGSFFLSINTAVLAFSSYVQSVGTQASLTELQGLISFAGIALCYMWYRLIRSYRDLNTAKFKVIHEIERRLPVSPYDAEWQAVGRGENAALYLPFTHIEIGIPWVFMGLHAVMIIVNLPWADIFTAMNFG